MIASMRLTPNVSQCGEELTLEPQAIEREAAYKGKLFSITIFEIDGSKAGQDLANFSASIENSGSKENPDLVFQDLKREDSFPSQLPVKESRKSSTGDALSFSPDWQIPHFNIRFKTVSGPSPAFVVLIRSDAKEREGYVYEIGFKVVGKEGTLFESLKMPSSVNCTLAMAENCKEAALQLFKDHHELISIRGFGDRHGSNFEPKDPIAFKKQVATCGLTSTHCIGYLLEASKLGHGKSLAANDWKAIVSHMENAKGTTLAKGLEAAGWEGIYYCLDTENPWDKERPYKTKYFSWNDHAITYAAAKKKKDYYGLRVHHTLVNYNPTVQYWDGKPVTKATPKDSTGISKLKTIPFAILNARAGEHTAMLISGEVYEVHWDRGPDDMTLYAKSDFETEWKFPWLSGIIHVPPGMW